MHKYRLFPLTGRGCLALLRKISKSWDRLSVPYLIMGMFVLISLVGGALLSFPISSNSGTMTNFLDSWFTAVSAVCVTGNVTLNTMEHWNYFGRTVIIILIEIGGLGFMTLWATVFLIMGQKINFKAHKVLLEALNISDMSEVTSLIEYILKFSVAAQVLGAVLLGIDFIPKMGWLKGLYFAVFHSVSAFCNAGFDLFGDSMISFTNNPLVIVTIFSLIVIGGLGFIVWRDVLNFSYRHRLSWYSKIVVSTTLILIFGGTALFAITERNNPLFEGVNPVMKALNYMFMSITPRTAGYANVDYARVTTAGIFVTLILMFIGASSGSTGGGIKTSTLVTLLVQARSAIHRRGPEIFKRAISNEAITKAVFILVTGSLLIFGTTFLLLLTETIPEGFGIEYILMDVVSCFSTVGLSMGLTPNLTAFGKVLLIMLMLIGRIGILTVFWSSNMGRKPSRITYPHGEIMIG